jgi:2-polyprenyl-6-methoxyphenol hydroxylase-like FAD-dependent oxidoreductase
VLRLDGQPRHPPASRPGTGAIAPWRTFLDPILLTAAAQAGAKVEMGMSVHGLLRQGGRATGVTTSAGERHARLVIGADARNSRIARLAGAQVRGYQEHSRPVGADDSIPASSPERMFYAPRGLAANARI